MPELIARLQVAFGGVTPFISVAATRAPRVVRIDSGEYEGDSGFCLACEWDKRQSQNRVCHTLSRLCKFRLLFPCFFPRALCKLVSTGHALASCEKIESKNTQILMWKEITLINFICLTDKWVFSNGDFFRDLPQTEFYISCAILITSWYCIDVVKKWFH